MWKMSLSHFPASFENKIKGVWQSAPVPPCDWCEEQLLFVVGRELFGKLQDMLRVCLCALICLSGHDSLSARDESLLTRNYATRRNKRMRSKQTLSILELFHRQSVLSLCAQSTSEPGMTSFRTGLTVKQTFTGETVCTPEPFPGQSSRLCSVYQSVTGFCLYVVPVGLHDPDALTQPHPHPQLLFLRLQKAKLEADSLLLLGLGQLSCRWVITLF